MQIKKTGNNRRRGYSAPILRGGNRIQVRTPGKGGVINTNGSVACKFPCVQLGQRRKGSGVRGQAGAGSFGRARLKGGTSGERSR